MNKPVTLTLVIPLYNEAQRVPRVLRALEKPNLPDSIKLNEIRFVDDGSTDQTVKVIENWLNLNKRLNKISKIISYKTNHGRGYALRRGLKNITTDYASYIDGDLDIPLTNLNQLAIPMDKGVNLIIGSKKIPGAVCNRNKKLSRVIVGYSHTLLASLILGVFVWDFQGGFKTFSKKFTLSVLPHMTIDRWGFDMEVIFWAKKLGLSYQEIPLRWGASNGGSKVRVVRDSLRAIKDMVTIRYQGLIYDIKPLISTLSSRLNILKLFN